jgi:hypothetical protein
MSDMAGSSSGSGRGTGIPMPFYELFELMEFGKIGKDKQAIAQLMTRVFEKGYDFRFMTSQAIPVGINEVLIRLIYALKRHYCHRLSWKDSMPFGNNPTLQRMLLVGQGTLEAIDIADAAVRGIAAGNPIELLLRLNAVGVGRVTLLVFGEARNDVVQLQLKNERSRLVHELMNELDLIVECRLAQTWYPLYDAFDEINKAALEADNHYSGAFKRLTGTHASVNDSLETLGASLSDLKKVHGR